jgi:iron(II)-dependent oxidoreductase
MRLWTMLAGLVLAGVLAMSAFAADTATPRKEEGKRFAPASFKDIAGDAKTLRRAKYIAFRLKAVPEDRQTQARTRVESLAKTIFGAKQELTAEQYEVGTRIGELVIIPAGRFLMGNNGHEGFGDPDEFPQHSVDLVTYQIGKYEVTRGEYRRFMEARGYKDPKYWSPEGWKWKESDAIDYTGMHGAVTRVVRPNSKSPRTEPEHWAAEQEWVGHGYGHPRFTQTDDHPVVGVTYYEAEAYCKWAGGRLPTEAEWEKAARWDEKKKHANTWPWGDTWDAEKCNNAEDHNPAGGGYKVNQSAPVGSYPDGASPYGCMDMVGNAWEWVASWHRSYPGNSKPFDHTNRFRVVKGACWDDGASTVRCASRLWYLPPSSGGTGPGDSDYIGFRVAR